MWLERLPIRGGNWNNGANAGVFALNLHNPRSNASSNIGFRPALGEGRKAISHGVSSSAPLKGPASLGQVPENMNRPGWDSSLAATFRPGRHVNTGSPDGPHL